MQAPRCALLSTVRRGLATSANWRLREELNWNRDVQKSSACCDRTRPVNLDRLKLVGFDLHTDVGLNDIVGQNDIANCTYFTWRWRLGFYSVFPCFFITALLLVLAATPFLKPADAPPTDVAARVSTIDGLRGLLALAVFFHHAAVWHQYAIIDEWRVSPVPLLHQSWPCGRDHVLHDHWISVLVADAEGKRATQLPEALRGSFISGLYRSISFWR